ncbi:MAG: hypothetical protein ACHQ2Z_11140 [Elusimicrobiota bacterium]
MMIIMGLLLTLAAPSHAQTVPALPNEPTNASSPVSPENLDEVFSQFASGKPMIPTMKQVEADRRARDLSGPPLENGSNPDAAGASLLLVHSRPSPVAVRREMTESVDVAVSRPAPRLEFGAGYAERSVDVGYRPVESDDSVYGFARVNLAKTLPARKLFHSPTAVHTQIEAGEKLHVSAEDYTTRFLTHPNE